MDCHHGMATKKYAARRVGYWLTDKKIRRLNFDAFVALCRSSGIDMVKLNFDRPLEQQGPFQLILHKITDQLARTQDGSQTALRQIEAVKHYLSTHPEVKVIDPIDNVMKLLDRHQQYQFVKDCDIVDEQCRYFIPSFTEFTTSDIVENRRLIAENDINFPIVCKPSLSHCYGPSAVSQPQASHDEQMAIVFNEAGLADIETPCVAQSFVNHNARLFKIFIIGSRRFIIQRPSIKNFIPGQDHKTIFFNSNDVSKSYSSSHLNKMVDCEVDYPIIEPDERKMLRLVSGIQKKFELDLLGIDVIIENSTGRYGVIDINAFPGYDGVEQFFPSLLELIEQKLPINIPPSPNRTTSSSSPAAIHAEEFQVHHRDCCGSEIIMPPLSQHGIHHKSFYHDDIYCCEPMLDRTKLVVTDTLPATLASPPLPPPSPSVHDWYYFTASFCSDYLRQTTKPSSCGSHLERPLVEVAGTGAREQVVAVSSCAPH